MTLQEAYERANNEQYATLRSLQDPGLQPWEIATLIERLELNQHYLRWLSNCMTEQHQIH